MNNTFYSRKFFLNFNFGTFEKNYELPGYHDWHRHFLEVKKKENDVIHASLMSEGSVIVIKNITDVKRSDKVQADLANEGGRNQNEEILVETWKPH